MSAPAKIEGTSVKSPIADPEVVSVRAGIPRSVEVVVALIGLAITAPIVAIIALATMVQSRGPVIFRQQRVGQGGRNFTLYKLRTMVTGSSGPLVTALNDKRVTRLGALLRKTKLDELPELWNVLRGDMSLVGPRPEVPCYVNLNDPLWQEVLRSKPGITDPVTVRLRSEATLLASIRTDSEQFYKEHLLPYKLKGYLAYQRMRGWQSDLKVIGLTCVAVLFPSKVRPPQLREILAKLEARNTLD